MVRAAGAAGDTRRAGLDGSHRPGPGPAGRKRRPRPPPAAVRPGAAGGGVNHYGGAAFRHLGGASEPWRRGFTALGGASC